VRETVCDETTRQALKVVLFLAQASMATGADGSMATASPTSTAGKLLGAHAASMACSLGFVFFGFLPSGEIFELENKIVRSCQEITSC
jgi:hypothetical protein